MALASSSVAGMVASTMDTGMSALPPAPADAANRAQAQRPATTPNGSPVVGGYR
jgi:hypothetical protein